VVGCRGVHGDHRRSTAVHRRWRNHRAVDATHARHAFSGIAARSKTVLNPLIGNNIVQAQLAF
jgi:hypothetical protein